MYPWDMCRNIHQDKKARYIVISVRVKYKEKGAFGIRKSRVYCAQSIRLECVGRQTLWTRTSAQNCRFCIFVFSVLLRVQVSETWVLLLSAVSDSMSN